MKKFIWKLRFAFYIHTRGDLPFDYAWRMAEEAYINTRQGPINAASEELGYWGEQ